MWYHGSNVSESSSNDAADACSRTTLDSGGSCRCSQCSHRLSAASSSIGRYSSDWSSTTTSPPPPPVPPFPPSPTYSTSSFSSFSSISSSSSNEFLSPSCPSPPAQAIHNQSSPKPKAKNTYRLANRGSLLFRKSNNGRSFGSQVTCSCLPFPKRKRRLIDGAKLKRVSKLRRNNMTCKHRISIFLPTPMSFTNF